MRGYILLAALVVVAPAAAQNQGACNYRAACPWRCCRGTPGDETRCWCSRCCLSQGVDLGPDDRAQTVREKGRIVSAYRHRVEFQRDGEATPRAVRRFREGVHPLDPRAGKDGIVLVCTSAQWGVVASTGAEKGFCGGFDLDGRVMFRLEAPEAAGLAREPLGTVASGAQALFALTKTRKGGDREVVGYRLWAIGRTSRLLAADGPEARKLLEEIEGPLLLPGPSQGN
jgi:hypothetical protein